MPRHKREHKPRRYYIVIMEWDYPSGQGSDVLNKTFLDKQEALNTCKELCQSEMYNYMNKCLVDCLPPAEYRQGASQGPSGKANGYVLTSRDGLTGWWYSARIVKLHFGYDLSTQRR